VTNQHAALLRLLSDEEPATLALVRSQLAAAGIARLEELRGLLPHAAGAARQNLRGIISEIESREADNLFTLVCAKFGEHGDIEDAAWRLAGEIVAGHERRRQRGFLDTWAAEIRRRLPKAQSAVDRIETLVEFLGDEVELRGNEDDYYNINNSLLPEIIDTRRGIPITLSLIYLLVAQRVGLAFSGVGFPVHFLVRSDEHFFDPFHSGRRVGMEDCRAMAERHGFALRREHFQPVTPRQMLTRMLGNILALSQDSDPPLAAKVADWIETLGAGERSQG
jgi:regulator of sirC expression with transglutaminase-like and TPR domain